MGEGMLVNSNNMWWLNKWPLKEWKEFPKFQKRGNFQKPQKCRNSSGNLGSAGTFQKLHKHGNNLQKPRNVSTSSETLEGHLIGILTHVRSVETLTAVPFTYRVTTTPSFVLKSETILKYQKTLLWLQRTRYRSQHPRDTLSISTMWGIYKWWKDIKAK